MLTLPGLVDVHVHLRAPGAAHKEDYDSGTAAALAGGFTTVLAMPNTSPPLVDAEALQAVQSAAASARCDYGLFVGANDRNADTAAALAPCCVGLKMYLDATYGPLKLDTLDAWRSHLESYPRDHVIAVHAEGRTLAAMIGLAASLARPVHLCHVSRQDEIELIRSAKEQGIPVTCEVTPQHLLLCDQDLPRLGPGFCEVRPRLASAADREALWRHLDVIDCFATDHAPHTVAEKRADSPPPGMPGLETALPLLLTAVHEQRLTLEQLVARLHHNPRRIFGLPDQEETRVEVDTDAEWEIGIEPLHTRCGWTPFAGMRVRGRVRRVWLRGQEAFCDGVLRALPGTGRDVRGHH